MLVEALRGLEIIASRAHAVGSDYLLAGPLNLWFHGVTGDIHLLYILVTSHASGAPLDDALSVNSKEIEWPESWSNIEGKKKLHLLYGKYTVGVLVDPHLHTEEEIKKYNASTLALRSRVVTISNLLVRLAPLSFEAELSSIAPYEDIIKADNLQL